MQDKFCLYCVVKGKVQGVWYRVSTQKQAQNLGLTGWVRNASDGSVEVLICGQKERVMQLFDWLHQGPPKARVTEVNAEERDWVECEQFAIT